MAVEVNPRLWPAFVYGLIGGVGWAILVNGADGVAAALARMVFLLGGAMTGLTAAIYVGSWAMFLIDTVFRSLNESKASVLARQLQGLTEEQVGIVAKFIGGYEELRVTRDERLDELIDDFVKSSAEKAGN